MADACDAAVRTWWNDTTNGPFVDSFHNLSHVKLAPIGTDGKYPPGEIAYESTHTLLAGKGITSAVSPWPGQCALAVSFLTSKPGARGRASKGRIYLPPLRLAVGSTGHLGAPTTVVQGIVNLLAALNAISTMGQAAVFSKVGVGDHYPIQNVRAGQVVDTIRRRRRQLAENYTAYVPVPGV
jgi:hypothetical protein